MRIEDYALIGDCETAALVSRGGSIDWLCWPRFDSPACFAALLGTADNGLWRLCPTDAQASISRSYRQGTLILETLFETSTGKALLIDFMPPRDGVSDLIRVVVGQEGEVEFETELVIRTDYGRTIPWVNRCDERTMTAVAGPDLITLRTDVEVHGEDMRTVGTFAVRAGETVSFVLSHGEAVDAPPPKGDPLAALADTERFWRDFSDRCPDLGAHSEQIKRSLITLKALTYGPTGGIVAAATTSLPEWIGGQRNWDYRFCWLRDATLTLIAFMKLGYYEEASSRRDWLLRAIAGAPEQIQIMYGLSGERWLPEFTLPWLAGYEESPPVRIGNAASTQLQLDIYGEVIDALTQAVNGGVESHPRGRTIAHLVLEHLASIWRQPDYGIWEVRGEPRHFVHSKVMAWVAFDRAADGRLPDPDGGRSWRSIADEIHEEICRLGYDDELGSFVQSYGSKQLDASLLLLPVVGFLPPGDPRVRSTVEAVERRLIRDGLVRRYDTDQHVDGLPDQEGTFLACSFWLVDALVLVGRVPEATALFDRLCGLCNDVGLLAEQYDPVQSRMLGNFPQAFSHVGLINAGLRLSQAAAASHDGASAPQALRA